MFQIEPRSLNSTLSFNLPRPSSNAMSEILVAIRTFVSGHAQQIFFFGFASLSFVIEELFSRKRAERR